MYQTFHVELRELGEPLVKAECRSKPSVRRKSPHRLWSSRIPGRVLSPPPGPARLLDLHSGVTRSPRANAAPGAHGPPVSGQHTSPGVPLLLSGGRHRRVKEKILSSSFGHSKSCPSGPRGLRGHGPGPPPPSTSLPSLRTQPTDVPLSLAANA